MEKKKADSDMERLLKFIIWAVVVIAIGIGINFILKRWGIIGS